MNKLDKISFLYRYHSLFIPALCNNLLLTTSCFVMAFNSFLPQPDLPVTCISFLESEPKLTPEQEAELHRRVSQIGIQQLGSSPDPSLCDLSTSSVSEFDSDDEEDDGAHVLVGDPTGVIANPLCALTRPGNKRAAPKIVPRKDTPSKKARPNRVYVTERITPDKPDEADPNQYRVIILSNGLTAILIQKKVDVSSWFSKSSRDPNSLTLDASAACRRIKRNVFGGAAYGNHTVPVMDNPSILPILLSLSNGMFSGLHQHDEKSASIIDPYGGPRCGSQCQATSPPSLLSLRGQLEATFAVVVNAGSSDDPKDCPGLAHFTEHMLHYGSAQYPQENHYWGYMNLHSFGFNAFTENHTTTYYTTVVEDSVDETADVFGNMLAEPLFHKDMTRREVQSIDAEFNLKRHFHLLRRYFLFQQALQGHPLSKFGFGNEQTLLSSKSLTASLKNFHSAYYVASAMTVGLESHKTLDEQEQIILKKFGKIKQGNRGLYHNTPVTSNNSLVSKTFNMDYIIQGICSNSSLWLAWPIPENFRGDVRNKALSVFCSILGSEGQGTLSTYLQERGYIQLMDTQNQIDIGIMNNKYSGFLTIDFVLTPEGESHVDEVMRETYAYINFLSQVPDDEWDMQFSILQILEQRRLHCGTLLRKCSPPDAVTCATSLQFVTATDALMNESAAWEEAEFRANDVHIIIDCLQPSRMITIQTLSQNVMLEKYVPNGKVLVAPYSAAKYKSQEIHKRFGNLSGSATTNDNFKSMDMFALHNPYLQDLDLYPPVHEVCGQQVLPMPSVSNVKILEAIHFGNVVNRVAHLEGISLIHFITPLVNLSARNFGMALLWTTAAMISLVKEFRRGILAGVMFAAVPNKSGISVGAFGFPENVLTLLGAIMDRLYSEGITEQKFRWAKKALLGIYDLLLVNNSELITSDFVKFMNCQHSKDPLMDTLPHIQDCTLEDLRRFTVACKREAAAVIVVQGNIPLTSGYDIAEIMKRQDCSADLTSMDPLVGIRPYYTHNVPFRTGEQCLRVKSQNQFCYTTTVTNFYYLGVANQVDANRLWASTHWTSFKCFEHLRMNLQLGYAVYSDVIVKMNRQMCITVTVTATDSKFTVHRACTLDKEIDGFMVEYGKFLNTLSDETLAELKKVKDIDYGVKMSEARDYYQAYFGQRFASSSSNKYDLLGILKRSIQIIGQNSKSCNCEKCKNIANWKKGEYHWKHFTFAQGKNKYADYFIDDPQKVRNGS